MKTFTTALAAAVMALSAIGTQAQSPLYGQRASLFAELPVDSTNIVMLGNSITHYCEWHELLGNPKVLNRGISGDVAQGVYDRLGSILPGHPAKIFLMIGVNDISHDLSADSICALTEKIVDRIQAESPQTKLYLQSCLPVNEKFKVYKGIWDKTPVVPEVNEAYRRMAARKCIPYIDLYTLFVDESGSLREDLTNDGLHLTAPGYLLWREALKPYL